MRSRWETTIHPTSGSRYFVGYSGTSVLETEIWCGPIAAKEKAAYWVISNANKKSLQKIDNLSDEKFNQLNQDGRLKIKKEFVVLYKAYEACTRTWNSKKKKRELAGIVICDACGIQFSPSEMIELTDFIRCNDCVDNLAKFNKRQK